ncbi:MAG: hypothetical protein R3229_03610 [Alphaproteobacteria bacterium]|nr:hypothetical protein [Alphaproteobacteria bacterium]
MGGNRRAICWGDPLRRCGVIALSFGGIASLFAIVLSLSLTLASSAEATREAGYRSFAKVSNREQALSEDDCRKYGGRPVTNGEYDVVMNGGRSDGELYNVLYFSGYQYVTYKIDASNSLSRLFGIATHKIGLCQF